MNTAPTADMSPQATHATAVVVRDAGVLIRGRSGAGKSRLALALIDVGRTRGWNARLVGDDRVFVRATSGRLIVTPHPAILGKIEHRGVGIIEVPYQAHAVVRLVIDLVDAHFECDIPPRLPPSDECTAMICGIAVGRMTLLSGASAVEAAVQVLAALRGDRIEFGREAPCNIT